MDPVLGFLVALLLGSIGGMILIPPFLFKIDRTGRVNFFGIKFP